MDKEEVNKFLESKILLQIGTIDEEGDPNIHPVWFNYDKDREKLLVITPKITKKVKNLRSKPNVYFSVDDVNITYKGVKRQRHCHNNRRSKKNCLVWRENIYEISWHTRSPGT
jgi:nitroimidazol reductase NimA-like FMN-containing flavoprotein (pyridoxamine 5'-phosphate oxidase superfamily)